MKTQYQRTTYAISIRPWDGTSANNSNPERALWLAVLDQAFADLMANVKVFDPENRYYQSEAYRWFSDGGRDFHLVCDLAGAEPGVIREKALARVEQYRKEH